MNFRQSQERKNNKNKRAYMLPQYQSEQKRKQVWKNQARIKNSPSASFGKSGRNSAEKVQGPGPGTYNIDLPIAEKHMISLKGSRILRYNTDAPGPAAYTPVPQFPSKKYSFSRSKNHMDDIINQIRPSPTSYSIGPVDKPHPISFSQVKRQSIVSQSKKTQPGPGNYETQIKDKKNNFSFYRSKKFLEEEIQSQSKEKIPGPGTYQIAQNRHKLQSFKFAQAMKSTFQRQNTPGPGCYDKQISMLSHNGVVMSKEKRNEKYENGVPGPGNYKDVAVQMIKNRSPNMKFSRAEGLKMRVSTQIGPGQYDRTSSEFHSKVLGGSIGREQRNSLGRKQGPSPLNYNPKYEEVLTKSAKVVFTKQKRLKREISLTPGPGYYDLISSKNRRNKTELSRKDYRHYNNTSMSNKR